MTPVRQFCAELARFFVELATDWVAGMSGFISVILMAVAAARSDSLSVSVFWPCAYLCLMVSAFRLWSKGQQKRSDPHWNAVRHEADRRIGLYESLKERCTGDETDVVAKVRQLDRETAEYLGRAYSTYTAFLEPYPRGPNEPPPSDTSQEGIARRMCERSIRRLREVIALIA